MAEFNSLGLSLASWIILPHVQCAYGQDLFAFDFYVSGDIQWHYETGQALSMLHPTAAVKILKMVLRCELSTLNVC